MGSISNFTLKSSHYDQKNKLDSLELLRFLGAMAVVIFHYNKITGTTHDVVLFPFYDNLKWFYIHGGSFVEAFFLISGFTFFYIYGDQIQLGKIGFKKFFCKRIVRLYPLYWYATILTLGTALVTYLIFGCVMSGIGGSLRILSIIPSVLGVNMVLWPTAYPFLGPAWTLGIEMLCYVIFYTEMKYVKSIVLQIICEIALIATAAIIICCNINIPIFNTNVARGVYCFFGGGILFRLNIFLDIHEKIEKLIILLAFILLFIWYSFIPSDAWYGYGFILFPAVLFLLMNFPPLRCIVLVRPLIQLGKLSYSIYMNQIFIFEVWYFLSISFSATFSPFYPYVLIGVCLSLVLYSSWTCLIIEKQGKIFFLKLQVQIEHL